MAWNVVHDRAPAAAPVDARIPSRACVPARLTAANSMSDDHDSLTAHEKIETNNFLMIVLILLVVAVGGLVEIVPLFFQQLDHRAGAGPQALHARCNWRAATSTSARVATTATRR